MASDKQRLEKTAAYLVRVPRPLLRQAAVRLARSVHLACRHARGCARPRGRRGALALCAASTRGTGARGSSPRRLGAHHAQEGVRRRDGRGRHGPAVPALPLGDERPPPRFHTVRYAGVLAAASPWRSRIVVPRQNRIRPLRGQPFRGSRPGTRRRIPVSRQGMGRGRWKPGPAGARLKRIHCPCSVRERGATQATPADSPARKSLPDLARVVLRRLE
jgi:hypothetical protein